MRPTLAGSLKMLAMGAAGGTVLDGFHSHSGTISYPDPVFSMEAWWVPLLFAGAYTLLGVSWALARKLSGAAPIAPVARWTCALAFGVLYFASGYLPVSNAVKLGVLVAGFLVLWLATDRSWGTVAVGLLAAVLGPTTEVVLVHLHLFAHLQPDVAGIPMWLPGLFYLASAPGAGPLMAWLGHGHATATHPSAA
ncbi:MAG: hypothetical protein JST54_10130 [Deltaproteobacteria bacterium]|nr:hypothetical protein [Deltaproteobacteria bacterium]